MCEIYRSMPITAAPFAYSSEVHVPSNIFQSPTPSLYRSKTIHSLDLFGTAVQTTTMINRIRQYPRVKQSEDRAFSPSPANRLLYILAAVRELYNTSSDGHSADNIRDFGYNQLVAFLHQNFDMSEEEISQHLRIRYKFPDSSQLNGLSDFVRWATSLVLEWADNSNERISIALEAFQRVEERLCLEDVDWQKTVEEDPYMGGPEAKRFSTLSSLLNDSFAILVKHHAAVSNYHHLLGFREIEMLFEETDTMLEPYHHYVSEVWTWSAQEGHAKRVEETLPMLLAVLNVDGETAICFLVEYALLLFLPLMPQLVDAAYDLIPGQLWVETLEEWGMGEFAAGLGREFGLRNDRRLGLGLRGKLGSMLGNDKNGQKDVDVEEDIGVQLGSLRITDGRE
jgi:hypothetical protein